MKLSPATRAHIESAIKSGTAKVMGKDHFVDVNKKVAGKDHVPDAGKMVSAVPTGPVVDSFILYVQMDVPSVNAAMRTLQSWMGTKKRVKAAVAEAWHRAGRPRIVTPYTHSVVFLSGRKRDPMNRAWTLWKPGVDWLVGHDAKALPGDSVRWDCGGTYGWKHDPKRNLAVWTFVAVAPEF